MVCIFFSLRPLPSLLILLRRNQLFAKAKRIFQRLLEALLAKPCQGDPRQPDTAIHAQLPGLREPTAHQRERGKAPWERGKASFSSRNLFFFFNPIN